MQKFENMVFRLMDSKYLIRVATAVTVLALTVVVSVIVSTI